MTLNTSRSFFATVLLVVCAGTHAQQHEARQAKSSSVQLGDVAIVIPDPEGYEEVSARCPAFRQRMVATEALQNDMLLAYLLQNDCESLSKGESSTINNYAKVSVLKAGREITVSRETLTATVEGFRKNFDTLTSPESSEMKELQKNAEQKLTELDSRETKIDLTKPQFLGEFNAGPDVHSFLALVPLKMKSGAFVRDLQVLVSTSLVRVKERMIFVYTFNAYRSNADLATVKQFTTKWTAGIVTANRAQ